MTYYDSAAGLTIGLARIAAECRSHGVPFLDWLRDHAHEPARQEWPAQYVLEWLGY